LDTLTGHSANINQIRCNFRESGKLFSVSDDKSLRQWDVVQKACVLKYRVGDSKVVGLGYDPDFDPNVVVTSLKNGIINIWDTRQKESALTLKVPWGGQIRAIHLSRDRIVSSSNDCSLVLWNYRMTTRPQWRIIHTSVVSAVSFDDSRLVCGSTDNNIYIWNNCDSPFLSPSSDSSPLSPSVPIVLSGHSKAVSSVQFDETKVVSGSLDESIRVWDMEKGGGANYTLKDKKVAVGHSVIHKKNLEKEKEKEKENHNPQSTKKGSKFGRIRSLQFSDDKLISAHGDAIIRIWEFI